MVKSADTQDDEPHIGDLLRELRIRRGFSVRALAAHAGFSPSFISQVENGQAAPSISSLERLVQALGMSLGEFFRSAAPATAVVRANERAELANSWSRAQIEALGPTGPGHALEPMMITLAPGGRGGSQPYARCGDEFAFIFEGDVTLTLGDALHRLARGDAATFPAETPHCWENVGREPARIVVVSAGAR